LWHDAEQFLQCGRSGHPSDLPQTAEDDLVGMSRCQFDVPKGSLGTSLVVPGLGHSQYGLRHIHVGQILANAASIVGKSGSVSY
jgi:hypothetical protein